MRILLVDDKKIAAEGLKADIQRVEPDFEVAVFTSAESARKAMHDPHAAFDVMLIDRMLGEEDGIDLLCELRKLNPDCDAMVFTGYVDQADGQRAIEAGACDYFTKPLDDRRLLSQLRRLSLDRNLNKTMANLLQAGTTQEVADIIVRGGRQLGFERARLWRVNAKISDKGELLDKTELVGISEAGNEGLEGFGEFRQALCDSPYAATVLASRQPEIFTGRPKQSGLDRRFADKGFDPPVGEWVELPLFEGDRLIGLLVLDNADCAQPLDPEQRRLLRFFAHQAAAALARVVQHEETQLLMKIGQEVTTQAAIGDFDKLLDTAREQIGKVMAVENFMVVLLDEDSNHLDFRWKYEEGKLQSRYWRTYPAGLCGEVIQKNIVLLLPQGGEDYRRQHGIPLYGRQSQSWLGVPLCIDGMAIGALVVQDYQELFKFGWREERLLRAVADQIAGSIWLSHIAERNAETERYKDTHIALGNELRRLAEDNEDWFWHAVLTAVTHHDGLSFNRAVFLRYEGAGTRVQGRMGIGHLCRKDARRAWEEDKQEDKSFRKYLQKPHLAYLRPTPLQELTMAWSAVLEDKTCPCYRLWERGQRLSVFSTDLYGYLPTEILQPSDLMDGAGVYECALVPAKLHDAVFGVLVVDNAFDGEPLRKSDLDSLEELLAEAVQVWSRVGKDSQIQRLGVSYGQLLETSRHILAQLTSRTLKEDLDELCREAQVIAQADCVVIYPYRASGEGYDLELVSHVGLRRIDEFQAKTKNKPRQQGVTFSILQSGVLTVSDVTKSDLAFGGRPLVEHDFLSREEVKALIGVPMRNASGESLGVIYFDYRIPQKFTEQDIARAEHIAAIGSAVISYAREMEQETRGRVAAEEGERRRRRDMQLLSKIQTQALSSDSDEKKVVRAILQNASELFGRAANVTLALLDWETAGQEPRQFRRDYHLGPLGRLQGKYAAVDQGSIGHALGVADPYMVGNTLAASIRLGQHPIGAILLQKTPKGQVFEAVDKEMIERLVTVAALALDNVRVRAYLQTVSETVAVISDPSGLKETLSAVLVAARKVAPDIECVTLWYEDPDRGGELVLGSQWGISTHKHQGKNAHTTRLVRDVMRRQKPLFAPVAEREECLRGDFVRDEGITSVAAFPLRFGNRPQAFGALFLNYRKAHEFTPMERTLFPIFANAAATAIHDEQAIELAERRGKRLTTAIAASTAASATLPLDQVLRGVLTTLRDEFQRGSSDEAAPYIMLYNERENCLDLPSVAREFYQPDRPEYQGRVRLALSAKGITCRVALKARAAGKVVVENVRDVSADPEYVEVNSRTRSELCAGLVSDKRLLGALVIKSLRCDAFGLEDERLFELVAQQVAIAVDLVERAKQTRFHGTVAGITAWASEVAHDLRHRSGLLNGYLERLYQIPGLPPHALNDIEQALGTVSYLRTIALAQSSEPEDFVLFDWLDERVRSYVAEGKMKTVDFQWIDPGSTISVFAKKEPIWRAIRHIMNNAVSVMTKGWPGEKRLMFRLVSCNDDPGKIALHIEDSGPGVPDEVLPCIFFERCNRQDPERGNGLLLARFLTEDSGGSIALLRTETGKGSTFAIRLPQSAVVSTRGARL